MEVSAPPPPESATAYLPDQADSFPDGLWQVLLAAFETFSPELYQGLRCCLRALCAVLLTGAAAHISGKQHAVELAGVAAVAAILIAYELELEFAMSAGIVAILTIQPTKKETIRVAMGRLCAFLAALIIAYGSFCIFGYTVVAFLYF